MGKSRSRGWKPEFRDPVDTSWMTCLDCGFRVQVHVESNATARYMISEMSQHDLLCVPGKDTTPTGPIGLAFGMSIQLRDLFVMAQLSAKNNVIVTGNDAAFMYANADRLLAERDKDK
jgi:hypothetical protein